MGSLFKPPKYTPPPAMERSNKLLDERDLRADATEKSEKRKLAARGKESKKRVEDYYILKIEPYQHWELALHLIADENIRNPMDDERMMT